MLDAEHLPDDTVLLRCRTLRSPTSISARWRNYPPLLHHAIGRDRSSFVSLPGGHVVCERVKEREADERADRADEDRSGRVQPFSSVRRTRCPSKRGRSTGSLTSRRGRPSVLRSRSRRSRFCGRPRCAAGSARDGAAVLGSLVAGARAQPLKAIDLVGGLRARARRCEGGARLVCERAQVALLVWGSGDRPWSAPSGRGLRRAALPPACGRSWGAVCRKPRPGA